MSNNNQEKSEKSAVPLNKSVRWQRPKAHEIPDGDLLVAVKTNKGWNTALVYVDDDGQTLRDIEFQDVWSAWEWIDVTLYVPLADILPTT